ncbi:MAG TPA: hypothetical protein VLE02_01990 [Nitrosarchaeum sp.]|nr:hypothetical protein [Nitrosarchaeum sp.]
MTQILNENILQFIPYYPDAEDDEYVKKIASKKEFYDYKLKKKIEIPIEPGTPLPHQILATRYFSRNMPENKGLIYQGMGSGKCVSRSTKILVDDEYVESQVVWRDFSSDKIFIDGEGGVWTKPKKELMITAYDFEHNTYIKCLVDNLYRQQISCNVKKLQFENSTLTVTQSHMLYCVDDKKWTNDFVKGKKYAAYTIHQYNEELAMCTLLNIQEELYMGYVYDFEVQTYHNYIAEGIVCHNTCIASFVIENMKEYDSGPALVFVRNEDLIKSYQDEILHTCTKNKYVFKLNEREKNAIEKEKTKLEEEINSLKSKLTKAPNAKEKEKLTINIQKLETEQQKLFEDETYDITAETKHRRVMRQLNSSYEFHTFDFFRKLPTNEVIKKRYSGRKIIIDEAHWLRKQKGKEKETEMYYNAAWRFLHNVDDCIILLMTGTPIWDNVSEIASLMNLILDENEQLPTGRKFIEKFFDEDKNLINKDVMIKAFKGKISYLRSGFSDIVKVEIGVTKPWLDNVIIYPTAMSDFQYKYYKQAEQEESTKDITFKTKSGKETIRKITTKGGTIYKLAKDASNFIYPIYDEKGNITGGGYGKKYFEQYCVNTKVKYKNVGGVHTPYKDTSYEITNKFFKRDIKEKLHMFSSKFAFVIEDMKAHPGEITFTYMGESVTRAGAILFGLCMKEHGFQWCKNVNQAKVVKPGKFAIITSNLATISTPSEIYGILKILGSKENVKGDYISHIIGSEKISLGVNIKNAKRVYDLSSHWNTSHKEQAIFRILRLGARKWLDDKNVEIYRVVAAKSGTTNKGKGYPKDAGFSDEVTIDIYTQQTSESKDKYNSQVHRLMKKIAWDCPLNYKANVSVNDVDGSRECDFKKCNYQCDGFDPTSTSSDVWKYDISVADADITTFNEYYTHEYKEYFKRYIHLIFRKKFALTLSDLKKKLGVNETLTITLLLAVDELIQQKIPITNRYGVKCYLKEKNDVIFLNSDMCEPKFFAEFLYCSNFLTSDTKPMEIQLLEEFFEADIPIIKKLCECTEESCAKKLLERCHYQTIVILVEYSVTLPICSKLCSLVLSLYKKELQETEDGRKFHTLYYTEYTGVGYDVLNKKIEPKGLTRIYVEDKKEWKFVEDLDEEKIILAERKKHSHPPSVKTDFGIIGIRDKTGKFKLYFDTEGEGKKKTRGRVCNSFSKAKILEIYSRINYLPKASSEVKKLSSHDVSLKAKNLAEYLQYFKNLEDDTTLRKVISLASTDIPDLCKKLEKWFEKHHYIETI